MGRLRFAVIQAGLATAIAASVTLYATMAHAGSYMSPRHPIAQPTGAGSLCESYAWACATGHSTRVFSDQDLTLVRRINARINRITPQIDDQRQYARPEVWALPTRRGGDCEDFALLKKRELMRAGIPAERLLIATVLDRQMRGHAVLVVRTHKGDMVLDNLSSRVLPWTETGYIFMKMQSPDRPGDWDAIIAGGPLLETSRG